MQFPGAAEIIESRLSQLMATRWDDDEQVLYDYPNRQASLEQSSCGVHLPSIGKSLLISVSSGWLPYSVISNVSTS